MPETEPTISAVVVAGGLGRRFGGGRPKQLAALAGRPVLAHTLAAFERSPAAEIILALPGDWLEEIEREAVRPFGFKKVRIVPGGGTRAASTRLGFAASAGDLVLIHDGVRPFVTPGLIRAVAEAAAAHGAALAAVPVRDTLKAVAEGLVRRTLDRAGLWQAQTPQGFRREILALALAGGAGQDEVTDDAALLEPLGLTAAVVPGSARNLKITTPEDLTLAEAWLAAGPFRTGHGYDLHRLVPGRPLWLGGLEIPFEAGLLGHSDADVLAHALADALLGAAALGDIGGHFPDQDPQWAGLSGARLLFETMGKVRAAGWELVNADLTLIGERPKIVPHRQAMAEALAEALGVSPGQLNLKATTTEGLDSTGQGLALAA
ncbi:MAG: 2-C-methyl-D-erythritol 4-phosphate cytidylyltransferase, partial [Candidatus Adiutrix sp.]|nr:2-C-methyl-D-erythritol 4-phosphate cytidylyltransferase [Candidatus Adiutrix sp.]